ncbi:hypothetical protein G4B88_012350 [Cannabis sativa]|uniref:DUF393 domain-containing protein n=1 Tax=Cannabis sativa TaxID=3483 RepID=A0A7J6I5R7_CANSA|nr:hypothetical protein G4B88_012350 [Cannabis sativa]
MIQTRFFPKWLIPRNPSKPTSSFSSKSHYNQPIISPSPIVNPILLQPRVVVYDGVCHLCHQGVKWVIKLDKHRKIKFCCLQSEIVEPYLSLCGLNRDDVLRRFLFVEGHGFFRLRLGILCMIMLRNEEIKLSMMRREEIGSSFDALAMTIFSNSSIRTADASFRNNSSRILQDPGLVKARSYDPKQGLESLTVVPISKARALQRRDHARKPGSNNSPIPWEGNSRIGGYRHRPNKALLICLRD